MGRSAISNIDFTVLILFLCIISFGILNISSVLPENASKQAVFFGIAVVIGLFLFLIQSILFESVSYIFYIFGLLLLVGVLLFGKEINGAKAWFVVGPINVQPVEIVKIATALTLAAVVNSSNFNINSSHSLIRLLVIIGLPIILLLLQPDVGSVLVFAAFFIALYREGFSGYWFILGIYAVILALFSIAFDPLYVIVGLLILALIFIMVVFFFKPFRMTRALTLSLVLVLILSAGLSYSSGYLFSKLPKHQKERVMVLIEGEKKYKDTSGYNLLYSKSAIAVGRLSGTGYKQGTVTKGKFVPEQHTDYIFCTVGEEWGFLGSTLLIILYIGFIARVFYLSERAKDKFLRVYGYSFASIILMHFMMNIGMVLGLFPTVGIPLPYFSYGGSSLLSFTLMFFIFLRLVYSDNARLI